MAADNDKATGERIKKEFDAETTKHHIMEETRK